MPSHLYKKSTLNKNDVIDKSNYFSIALVAFYILFLPLISNTLIGYLLCIGYSSCIAYGPTKFLWFIHIVSWPAVAKYYSVMQKSPSLVKQLVLIILINFLPFFIFNSYLRVTTNFIEVKPMTNFFTQTNQKLENNGYVKVWWDEVQAFVLTYDENKKANSFLNPDYILLNSDQKVRFTGTGIIPYDIEGDLKSLGKEIYISKQ